MVNVDNFKKVQEAIVARLDVTQNLFDGVWNMRFSNSCAMGWANCVRRGFDTPSFMIHTEHFMLREWLGISDDEYFRLYQGWGHPQHDDEIKLERSPADFVATIDSILAGNGIYWVKANG